MSFLGATYKIWSAKVCIIHGTLRSYACDVSKSKFNAHSFTTESSENHAARARPRLRQERRPSLRLPFRVGHRPQVAMSHHGAQCQHRALWRIVRPPNARPPVVCCTIRPTPRRSFSPASMLRRPCCGNDETRAGRTGSRSLPTLLWTRIPCVQRCSEAGHFVSNDKSFIECWRSKQQWDASGS